MTTRKKRKLFGEILIELGVVKTYQIEEALKKQRQMAEPKMMIGEILVGFGHIARSHIPLVLAEQERPGSSKNRSDSTRPLVLPKRKKELTLEERIERLERRVF